MTRPDAIKACCAAAYSSDLVALLLGDSYHPGGRALTRTLCRALRLRPGSRVLDVATGRGTSARLLAREYGVYVDGVDLSERGVEEATRTAEAAGLGQRLRFGTGDAEALDFADDSFAAAVCECAFCTFPDKAAAAAEIARVLRPGGRLGITDVVVDPGRLPRELTSLGAWIACIADARPAKEYADILTAAGLRTTHTERHDDAMARMVEQVRARIDVLRITARTRAEALGLDFDRAAPVLAAAEAAVADGSIGYLLLVAEKPA